MPEVWCGRRVSLEKAAAELQGGFRPVKVCDGDPASHFLDGLRNLGAP